MAKKSNIYNFLELNGFKLVEQNISEYFGDYSDIFSSAEFNLIFNSSRSIETIDIQSTLDNGNKKTYDLALVKALLNNEQYLYDPTSIDEYYFFLQNDFDKIRNLFTRSNYPVTKIKLEELEKKRAKHLFPGNR